MKMQHLIIILIIALFLGSVIVFIPSLNENVSAAFRIVLANELEQENLSNPPIWIEPQNVECRLKQSVHSKLQADPHLQIHVDNNQKSKTVLMKTQYSSGHMLVKGSVNGVDGFRFMLSTTDNHITLIDTKKVQSLDLKSDLSSGSRVFDFNRYRQYDFKEDVNIRIGPLCFPNQNVVQVKSSQFWGLKDEREKRFDGIIGLQALMNVAALVDPDKETLILAKNINNLDTSSYTQHKVQVNQSVKLNQSTIDFPAIVKQSGFADFHTVLGWSSAGNYTPFALHLGNNIRIQKPGKVINRASVGSDIKYTLGRTTAINMGPYIFEKPISTYLEVPAYSKPVGRIGTEIINRFKVIYDLKNRHIYLKPAERFNNPFGFDQTGITSNRMTNGEYMIHYVADKSPASKAGIKVGDIITNINGKAAVLLSDQEYKQLTYFSEIIHIGVNNKPEVTLLLERKI